MRNTILCGMLLGVGLAVTLPTPGLPQRGPQWRTRAGLSIGWLTPTRSFGQIGVATARLNAAPALAIAGELLSTRSPFGLRFSFVNALSTGMRISPAPGCIQNCTSGSKEPHGRFRAIALDGVATLRLPWSTIRLEGGPTLRQYHVGGFDRTAAAAPAGSPDPGPYLEDQSAMGFHVAVALEVPAGRTGLRAATGTFTAKGPGNRLQHDLLFSLGVRL